MISRVTEEQTDSQTHDDS